MSSPPPSTLTAAAPAGRSATGAAPLQTQDVSTKTTIAAAPHIICFACSRCEYPICDSSDLLLRKVRQGASEYAFHYDLDGLLDLGDKAVPCYSAAEVVHTSVVVSEALMKVPLPPAAQVVALESIVQSRKFWVQQRRSMNARLHEHGVAPLSGPTAGTEGSAATLGSVSLASATEGTLSTPATASGSPIVRRYGDSAESRIDLVCVRDSVLGVGVQECTQDRSAAATTLDSSSSPDPTKHSEEVVGIREGGAHASANMAPTVIHDPNFAHVPADVLKAATAPAARTEWKSPGNMTLREAYMEVNRTTLSSRAPWFQDYRCVGRVQCPDCHQALGFVFQITEPKKINAAGTSVSASSTAAAATAAATTSCIVAPPPMQGMKRPATTHDRDGDEEDAVEAEEERGGGSMSSATFSHTSTEVREGRSAAGSPAEVNTVEDRHHGLPEGHAEVDGGRLPHAKKTKNEKDAQAAATATTRRGFQEDLQRRQRLDSGGVAAGGGEKTTRAEDHNNNSPSNPEDGGEDTPRADGAAGEVDAPPRFVGLELKRIVQRDWDLHAFQDRYNKSRELSTFRELFPEAEELQSLYSRLLGLRTQTELYNSLLRRHKEQNDVQMALLNSNKDRMHTYDEKIKTMQQIIEAQRAQIEMQTRQIRNQEELVQSHRRQFATQQRQLDVGQLLLNQQSITIESQKEQLRLLKLHFQATRPEFLEALPLSTSPIPPRASSSLLGTEREADIEVPQRSTQNAVAVEARRTRRDDSAEEDWADTEDEDEEGERSIGATGKRALAPHAPSGYRSTPPAHLCGVSASLPFPRGRKTEPSGDMPHSLSPSEWHEEQRGKERM